MISLSYRQKTMVNKILFYAVALFITIWCLFPLVYIFLTSIKPPGSEFDIPIKYIPSQPSLENYFQILSPPMQFQYYLLNSIIVATIATGIVLFIASLAAFAIARLRFRYKIGGLLITLVVGMIPVIVTVAPIFMIVKSLGLIDTWWGLIIPHVVYSSPIAVWILTSYFVQLPFELDEQAMIDGYTPLSVYWRVIFPIASPGLFAAGILTFISSWGELLFALSITTTISSRTSVVAIATVPGAMVLRWGWICAMVTLTLIPVLIIIIVFQKIVIAGLTAGAVKY